MRSKFFVLFIVSSFLSVSILVSYLSGGFGSNQTVVSSIEFDDKNTQSSPNVVFNIVEELEDHKMIGDGDTALNLPVIIFVLEPRFDHISSIFYQKTWKPPERNS